MVKKYYKFQGIYFHPILCHNIYMDKCKKKCNITIYELKRKKERKYSNCLIFLLDAYDK